MSVSCTIPVLQSVTQADKQLLRHAIFSWSINQSNLQWDGFAIYVITGLFRVFNFYVACVHVPQFFFLTEIQLNDDNEKLQRQVKTKDGGQDSGSDAELRRLRAENAALQKSLTSTCTKLTQR